MYAIVETAGHQYRVEPGQQLVVDRLGAQAGSEITLDKVLLLGGESVQVGAPTVPGATVLATVVDHHLAGKVFTFKYRRRQRTRRRVGFRASRTTLHITAINP